MDNATSKSKLKKEEKNKKNNARLGSPEYSKRTDYMRRQ